MADITEDKKATALRLMLMSSSPGILDGDVYTIRIELAAGCSLELQTQAYQRLFSMKKGASQQAEVHLQDDASFCFLPHPVVPHKAADFFSRNKIFLSRNCRLTWGEVLTCGRKLNGEIFQFLRYHTITEIFLDGRLVVKENLLVQPATTNVNTIGQMEGYTHQASLIYLDETSVISELITGISNWLTRQPGIIFGITTAPVNGLIIRLLGNKGEQLHNCLKMIANLFLQGPPINRLLQNQEDKVRVNAY